MSEKLTAKETMECVKEAIVEVGKRHVKSTLISYGIAIGLFAVIAISAIFEEA